MTRERIARVIDFVDHFMQSHFNDYDEETHRALQEAIELIKQEQKTDCNCISRQAVLDVIRGCRCEDWIKADIGAPIEALSPVTPAEKVGHWITCDVLQEVKCSECRVCFRHTTNYCPNCGSYNGGGAKMESEGEE